MSIPEVYTRRQLNALYRAIPLNDSTFRLLRKYFSAAANLYGALPLRKMYEIINSHNPNLITKEEFISFAKIARHEREGYFILSEDEIFQGGKYAPFLDHEIIDTTLLEIDIVRYIYLKKSQYGKPYYVPDKKYFIAYSNPLHYDAINEVTALRNFLKERLHLEKALEDLIYGIVFFGSRCLNISLDTVLRKMEENGVQIETEADLNAFSELYHNFCNNTRMQTNRGHAPNEIHALKEDQQNSKGVTATPYPIIPFTTDLKNTPKADILVPEESFDFFHPPYSDKNSSSTPHQAKVGRNSPCPCGSGRKYKRCCGR